MEDNRIVDLYWQRSEDAIRETASKYGKYLHRIVYQVLSNTQDAEECVNDTYSDAWNTMPPHRPSILSTFLGKITRRISIDLWRKNSAEKRGSGEIALALDELEDCVSGSGSVEEADGVLPIRLEHTEQSFRADYNGDGSLYKVSFLWMRRREHGIDEYSDLTLVASPKELHEISDEIMIQIDQDGNAIPDDVTVTQRDGVLIYAKGKEDAGKAIIWQTEQGWYQIIGSWNDNYEDMIALLDWFWEHPLSLSRFETPKDGAVIFSDRAEQPLYGDSEFRNRNKRGCVGNHSIASKIRKQLSTA